MIQLFKGDFHSILLSTLNFVSLGEDSDDKSIHPLAKPHLARS